MGMRGSGGGIDTIALFSHSLFSTHNAVDSNTYRTCVVNLALSVCQHNGEFALEAINGVADAVFALTLQSKQLEWSGSEVKKKKKNRNKKNKNKTYPDGIHAVHEKLSVIFHRGPRVEDALNERLHPCLNLSEAP